MRLAFVLGFMLACTPGTTAPAQTIDVQFDYSNADATLDAFSHPDKAFFDRLSALPATIAVIQKRATRDSTVNAVVYQQTLEQAIARTSMNSDPFQWSFCIAQQQAVHKLLSELHKNEPLIRSRLIKAMSPQLSPASKLGVTVHYILGGVSAGWEAGSSDFYIGLPFYKGDLEGVVWTMQHELFHNAQFVGFHEQARDLARLKPRQQQVYRLMDELYREGTATYIGNIGSFSADTPFIQSMREPAMRNADRMTDNFILLETLIYRMAHDSHSSFEEVRSLGFDWDWQNPLYYAGEYMTGVVARQQGNIVPYLQKRPTAFVVAYIKDCTPAIKCSHPVSPDAAAEIIGIDRMLSSKDAHKE